MATHLAKVIPKPWQGEHRALTSIVGSFKEISQTELRPWYIPQAQAMTVPLDAPRRRSRRHYLPASLMRAGTSKGLFIHQKHLPASRDDWKPWILAAMGSKSSDRRQIDGVGGATSTTSKVAVVSGSNRPGVDVEYTFVQVAVGKDSLDFSGNCGNIASGIGPFAVEEGLVTTTPGQSHLNISIFNTNTGKHLVETVELDEDGNYLDEGDYMMPGVMTPGSEVKVAFMHPAGSMTGQLFPTGNRSEQLLITGPRHGVAPFEVRASLVDAANPFVVVDKSTMPFEQGTESELYLDLVEDIRRAGAVQMGLAKDTNAASLVKGTPKLAFVSPAQPSVDGKTGANLHVASMSMQKPHPSLQLTGAVCLGAAACIPGTVVYEVAELSRYLGGFAFSPGSPSSEVESEQSDESTIDTECSEDGLSARITRSIRLAHASGQIEVGVEIKGGLDRELSVESCTVLRTARRIFDGQVIINL